MGLRPGSRMVSRRSHVRATTSAKTSGVWRCASLEKSSAGSGGGEQTVPTGQSADCLTRAIRASKRPTRLIRLCSAERTTRPERTPLGHIRGQCTLTLTDANVAFPEFYGQSNLNSDRMLLQMFVIRFYCGIRSHSAFKAGTFSSHSCSLAVHLHSPVGDSHRQSSRNVTNTIHFAHARASVRFC